MGDKWTFNWSNWFATITAPASVRAEGAVRVLREAGLIEKETV